MPAMLKNYITDDGKVYLAPTGAHGESWAFYSKAAFEKAGITEEPKDWDTFFADMDKLKAAGIIPIAWGGQSWQEAIVFNMVLVTQVGLDGYMKIYTKKDESAELKAGIKSSLKILAKMRDYVDEGSPGRNWNDATAMLITGKAGVQFHGDWAKGEFVVAGMTPGKEYGCMLVPETPGMVFIADSFDFPKKNDAAEAKGQALLAEVIMDPKVQVEFSIKKGSIPIRADIDNSALDSCAQKGLKLMSEGKIVPDTAIIITPQQKGALSDFVDEFWSNPPADLDEAVSAFSPGLEGELVYREDLVLHDAHMDIRTPTHELTRAPAVLRARRRIFCREVGLGFRLLQRRASFQTRKGRCNALDCIILSLNRFRFKELCSRR